MPWFALPVVCLFRWMQAVDLAMTNSPICIVIAPLFNIALAQGTKAQPGASLTGTVADENGAVVFLAPKLHCHDELALFIGRRFDGFQTAPVMAAIVSEFRFNFSARQCC